MAMRLNQFLARAGLGSRRACEDLVRAGAVEIGGKIVRQLATQVGPSDVVKVHGKPVRPAGAVTAVLHKPKGYLCSTVPEHGERTIFELLPKEWPRVFYVGRLDKDSEGLLVVTNDGELSQKLAHPSTKVPKIYEVVLDREFDFVRDAERLRRGVMLREGRGRFDEIHRIGPSTVKVVLTQGIKRQIRLMFHFAGYKVRRLVRTQIGGLSLGKLPAGKWRLLDAKDVDSLLQGGGGRGGGRRGRPRPERGGLQRVGAGHVEQADPGRPEVRVAEGARTRRGGPGGFRKKQARPGGPRGRRQRAGGKRRPPAGQRHRMDRK